MDEIGKQRIDIALSGGGTRAALYSGGALIAVQEAVLAGKVEVGAIHAVSGSALMIARIILASDDREVRDDGEVDLQLIKDEVEAIARFGFAPSKARGAGMSLGIAAAILLSWWLYLPANRVPARFFLPAGSILALIVGAAVYQLIRRGAPFNLRRGHRRSLGREPTWQHKWMATDHCDRNSALPTSDVRFVCTSLAKGCVELVDPWHQHSVSRGMTRPASLADCAGASAAVPFYSSAVRVGHDVLVDGGALDNLGATALVANFKRLGHNAGLRPDRLIVVDSSVRKPPRVEVRDTSKKWREFAAIVMPLILTVSVLVAARLLGLLSRWLWLSVGLGLLALWSIVHFIAALVSRELLQLFRALRAETSVRNAVMEAHRTSTMRSLDDLGDVAVVAELSEARPFSNQVDRDRHDLRTRLSAVRGDTAVLLVRAGYEQVVEACGADANRKTLSWLEDLGDQLSPRRIGRRNGAWWRPLKAVLLFNIFGWGYKRYWFSVDGDGDSAEP